MKDQEYKSPQGQHSITKFLKGFVFAFQGLKQAFKTQINFKFHTIAAVSAVISGFYFRLSASEWLWVTAAIASVLITELINTAIEYLVDLVSPGYNIKAGMVKDLASAAVLLSAIFALTVAIIIFAPRLKILL